MKSNVFRLFVGKPSRSETPVTPHDDVLEAARGRVALRIAALSLAKLRLLEDFLDRIGG